MTATTMSSGVGKITDNGAFIFPKNKSVTPEDLQGLIGYHNQTLVPEYTKLKKEYLGNHPILDETTNKGGFRPDNRIVANLSKYIVETFNGYFIGIPPNITLEKESDNKDLQTWLDANSFQDKLSEISRQCDIYGTSIAFVYQDEESHTKLAYSSPETSFMIYDDTVAMNPIAFVRYTVSSSNQYEGSIYFEDESYSFSNDLRLLEANKTFNVFEQVPAVEFSANAYRQGLIENVLTLNNALDKAISQKANQNEYFDNAYLKIMGLRLPEDSDGNTTFNIDGNNVLYSPDSDASKADVSFLTKPDGDNMQEHLIDRLTNLIFQISMVSNLNDQAFSGNSSGVALKYKLLPMQNMAINKERKFTQSLRSLCKVIFSVDTIFKSDSSDDWKNVQFKFFRNLPVNAADEANTARTLEGIVSKKTQLSTLSFVPDPSAEIKAMKEEDTESIQSQLEAADRLTDQQKNSNDDQV